MKSRRLTYSIILLYLVCHFRCTSKVSDCDEIVTRIAKIETPIISSNLEKGPIVTLEIEIKNTCNRELELCFDSLNYNSIDNLFLLISPSKSKPIICAISYYGIRGHLKPYRDSFHSEKVILKKGDSLTLIFNYDTFDFATDFDGVESQIPPRVPLWMLAPYIDDMFKLENVFISLRINHNRYFIGQVRSKIGIKRGQLVNFCR